jgi:hypothetical protein
MNPPDTDHDAGGSSASERIISLARRGRVRYGQQAAIFGQWLHRQLLSESANGGSRPGGVLAMRHLPQRQQAYRSAGGNHASTARRALERALRLAESVPGARD